ncbi:MAG: histidine phosphatase family protein [Spirochaetales bacterium]|nr:histidine phosphatase family protein [Spirochaetales bacterium]
MNKTLRTIYLLRHGEALLPGDEGPYYIGRTDVPLSPRGKEQASRLAERFSGHKLQALFSSDLARSVETASIIALRGNHPEAGAEPSFREIDLGDWDGMSMEKVRKAFPEAYRRRGEALDTFRPPGGESFLDLSQRVMPAFCNLLEKTEGDILLVAHAGVNRVILCHILAVPLKNLLRISQACGCVNKIAAGNRMTVELVNG